jgi:aspartyl-tRNA(Asn)/glutamyl-tRNA(Gln) amidotransferase subunit A
VKDLIDQAGLPTTNGGSFPPTTPVTSAPSVARLEAAGAVMVGRTGLHEFAFGFSSENHWFGPVRNPWDRDLSPGGSSGGSGAAVAAGLVAAALGTDTGGSIRVPAALCGVVGLKVTHGRVPLTGVTPLAPSLDTVGPLTRTIEDATALYLVLAGDDPSDPWSQPQPVVAPGPPADLAALRVGVPHPWADHAVATEQAEGFAAALAALEAAGADVVPLTVAELDPPGLTEASMYPEVAAVHRARWQEPHHFGPGVRGRLSRAFALGIDDYIAGLAWRRRIQAAAYRALDDVDVLVTPTVGVLRKTIGDDEVDIAGSPGGFRANVARFSALVNHLGFPALAVPLPGASHPPPSLQVIGRPWSEHRLLEIGAALEHAGLASTQQPPNWRP